MINGQIIIHGVDMARYSPKVFDTARKTYVRRAFKANGKDYYPGMLFDWKHYAVAHRRVQLLFNSGYLRHDNDEKQVEEAPMPPAPEPITKMEMGDTKELTPDLEKKTPGYTIKHSGGRYHNVFSPDGEKVNPKGLLQENAIKLVEKLTMEATDETTVRGTTV